MKEILGEVFSINHAPTVFGEIQRMPSHVTSLTPASSLWTKKNRESTQKKNANSDSTVRILLQFRSTIIYNKCINCVNLDDYLPLTTGKPNPPTVSMPPLQGQGLPHCHSDVE